METACCDEVGDKVNPSLLAREINWMETVIRLTYGDSWAVPLSTR